MTKQGTRLGPGQVPTGDGQRLEAGGWRLERRCGAETESVLLRGCRWEGENEDSLLESGRWAGEQR